MVNNLLATMSGMIEDLSWMDNQTKTLAQEKVITARKTNKWHPHDTIYYRLKIS